MPFPDAFMKEVEVAFSQLDFCMAFNKLVPRVLPEELDLLDEYCVDELDKLLSRYDGEKFDIYNVDESHENADLNSVVQHMPKTLKMCKKSWSCLTQKASRCAADHKSKTTFFIFHFL